MVRAAYSIRGHVMGWWKTATVGDRLIEMGFSRGGRFHRHLDSGTYPEERLRVSLRHLRLVVRSRPPHMPEAAQQLQEAAPTPGDSTSE
jgi:hypothetical protein